MKTIVLLAPMAQRLLDSHKCHAVTAHPAFLAKLDLSSTIGATSIAVANWEKRMPKQCPLCANNVISVCDFRFEKVVGDQLVSPATNRLAANMYISSRTWISEFWRCSTRMTHEHVCG